LRCSPEPVSVRDRGFTLVEVLVALLVIALLAGAALSLGSNYLLQQQRAEEGFVARAVAWNPLLEQYRASNGWLPANSSRQTAGEVAAWGRQWRWQLASEPTMGEEFFRFQVNVSRADAAAARPGEPAPPADAVLVAYWVGN